MDGREKPIEREAGAVVRNIVVRQPRAIMLLGFICFLFFGYCTILPLAYENTTGESWWTYLIYAAFSLFGVVLMLHSFFWEIKVAGDEICYATLFKNPYFFTFGMITSVISDDRKHEITLYAEGRKILTMNRFQRGYKVFLVRLNDERDWD